MQTYVAFMSIKLHESTSFNLSENEITWKRKISIEVIFPSLWDDRKNWRFYENGWGWGAIMLLQRSLKFLLIFPNLNRKIIISVIEIFLFFPLSGYLSRTTLYRTYACPDKDRFKIVALAFHGFKKIILNLLKLALRGQFA